MTAAGCFVEEYYYTSITCRSVLHIKLFTTEMSNPQDYHCK